MWIFCGGMYRSASTLQYQIIAEILESRGLGTRIGWAKPEHFPQVKKEHEQYKGYKIFKCHEFTPAITREFKEGNALGLYIYRDVRDVIVSFMQKKGFSFQRVMQGKRIESCIRNYNSWTRQTGVYISRYEEVVMDMEREVTEIAAFFKIPLELDEIIKIAEKLSLSHQRERIERIKKEKSYMDLGSKKIDPFTLLHTDHISDARVNKWREYLTPQQARHIYELYQPWFEETGYKA